MEKSKGKAQGRPRLRLRAENFRLLPEIGPMSVFAKVLGIAYSTMREWVKHGLPAEIYVDPNSDCRSYVLRKDKFVRWLRATGRCEE